MRTLVLLHGWGASGRLWGGVQAAAACNSGCAVLAPEIPRWEAGWLAQYLRGLPLKESVLVGWSLGGMLLLEALAQLREPAPTATVLVAVPPVFCRRPDHPWGQPAAMLRAMRRALGSDSRRVLSDFALACLAPGEAAFREDAAAGFDYQADPAFLAQGLDYLRDTDLRGLLPLIRETTNLPGRMVIIQGEEDRIVPPAQGRDLQERLPGSELHLLAAAGHIPFLTQTAAVNGILRELLSVAGL
ncbi:MAG: alpha/beta fold hydrolase [Desulfobaccales bacterium]